MASIVQQDFVASNSNNPTFTKTVTAGNHLTILAQVDPVAFYPVSGITGGGTWVKADSSAANNNSAEIWYCENCTGGTITISVSYTGYSNQGRETTFIESSGLLTSGSLDVHGVAAINSSTTPTGPSLTPTGDGIMFVAASARYNHLFTGGPSGGFTALGNSGNNDARPAYQIITGHSGAYQAGYTSGGSGNFNIVAAHFLSAGGGGGAVAVTMTGVASITPTLTGKGALASAMTGAASITPTLTGQGALAVTALGAAAMSATLGGAGALATTLTGVASLTATLTQPDGAMSVALLGAAAMTATLTGSGALAIAMTGLAALSATLRGSGALATSQTGVASLTATLTQPGAIAASMLGTAVMNATLRGSGRLQVALVGAAAFSAVPSITGTLACTLLGAASLIASLTGNGWNPIARDNGPWATITDDTAGWTRIT